jgi:hypothetical protein
MAAAGSAYPNTEEHVAHKTIPGKPGRALSSGKSGSWLSSLGEEKGVAADFLY